MNPFPTGWLSFLVFGCFRFSTQNSMDWTLWKHSNVGFAWGVLDDGSVPVTDAALDGDVIEKKWCLWKSSAPVSAWLCWDLTSISTCEWSVKLSIPFAWFCTFPTFSYLLSPFRMILVKTEEWMSNDTMIHVNQWTFPAKMSHGASQRGALDGIGKRPCAMSTLPLVECTPCSRMPVDFSWLSPGPFGVDKSKSTGVVRLQRSISVLAEACRHLEEWTLFSWNKLIQKLSKTGRDFPDVIADAPVPVGL